MTYEFCKKLKDAGFPQEPRIDIGGIDGDFFGGFYYIAKQGIDEVAPNFLNERQYAYYLTLEGAEDRELVKIPQLEELIEATTLKILNCSYGMETINEWTALPYTQDFNEAWIGQGSTPVEAVGNLLLVLLNSLKQ